MGVISAKQDMYLQVRGKPPLSGYVFSGCFTLLEDLSLPGGVSGRELLPSARYGDSKAQTYVILYVCLPGNDAGF